MTLTLTSLNDLKALKTFSFPHKDSMEKLLASNLLCKMKNQILAFPYFRKRLLKSSPIKILLILLIIAMIPLYFFSESSELSFYQHHVEDWLSTMLEGKCNIFRGKWVKTEHGPLYTNATCHGIMDQQNCMKFGRPDTEYLKWKWVPNECELPFFDAVQFLEIVKGKKMGFVGDSLGRNHMQSLMCLLGTVSKPTYVTSKSDAKSQIWYFAEHNFTLASFWSPYLVEAVNAEPNGPLYDRLMDLYLDEPSPAWAPQIETFDYVIVSAGQWFYGPQRFYDKRQVVGCYRCKEKNVTRIKNMNMFYGCGRAFETTFRTLLGLENYKGITFLRTFTPAHFENGEWNTGGECKRTRPDMKMGRRLHSAELGFYMVQLKELREAEKEGRKRGLKFRILETSGPMVSRPDGHPNHFGHWAHEKVTIADCVHWCLPGPVDTWNEFLLYMLKMEVQETNVE
ncbi:PC-Esterase [Dillenia turbinata]|uniref:PC-Esterase n=1 Tax=Dillenia turbinata TaxID=194707 RepID=A0AAN8UDL1_9MAGN